jgi:WD40 repeat protein
MRSQFLAVLVGSVCVLSMAQAQERPGKDVSLDPYGDPLNGALARFGTHRWRHSDAVTFLAYLPDGKRVLTAARDGTMHLWERESGRPLREYKMPAPKPDPAMGRPVAFVGRGGVIGVATSPDGKLLAVGQVNAVQLFDIDSGKELRSLKTATANGIVTLLFSPDSKTLAVRGFDRNISLVDVASGNEIRKINIPLNNNARVFVAGQGITETTGMAFSPDGKSLVTGEAEFQQQKIVGFVRVTSVESGQQVRRIETPGGSAALVYSPDGKILAQGGGNTVFLRDAESGKEVRKLDAPSGVNSLVFSKDGKVLAGKGRDNVVRLWSAETGAVLHQLGQAPAMPGNNAALVRFAYFGSPVDLDFSPDGKDVAVGGAKSPRFWDVATGKERLDLGGHRDAVRAVAVSGDGKSLLTYAGDGTVRRWDSVTGKELSQFAVPPGTSSAAFSPRGDVVALGNQDGSIRLVDAVTGKERAKLNGHANGVAVLLFSADGKTLISRGNFDGIVRVHDVIHAAELRQIALFGDAAGAGRVAFGGFGSGVGLALSPDGKTLAGAVSSYNQGVVRGGVMPANQGPSNTIRLWDVGTGKELRKMDLPPQRGSGAIAFSPDGRLLAMENADQTFSLWEIASGKERAKFGEPGGIGPLGMQTSNVMVVGGGMAGYYGGVPVGKTLAFSPDGQLLATKGPDHSISVWQVANTKELADFSRHNAAVSVVAFAPDGKRIASGSADTTALMWDVANLACEPVAVSADLGIDDVVSLWNELAGDDASKAYKAVRTLAGNPKRALPLLRKHLVPAEAVDPNVLDQLLADLESEKFTTRNKAKEELEKLGELAVPALQKLLNSDPPLETRRRIEPLLAKQLGGVLTNEQLRVVRAVELLELMASNDAREILVSLAKGAPGALPTRQAQSVLERLKVSK